MLWYIRLRGWHASCLLHIHTYDHTPTHSHTHTHAHSDTHQSASGVLLAEPSGQSMIDFAGAMTFRPVVAVAATTDADDAVAQHRSRTAQY